MFSKIGTSIILSGVLQSLAACGSTDSGMDGGPDASSTTGDGGAGGGSAGEAGGGANNQAGAPSELSCASDCDACPDGFELVACKQSCVCESTNAAAKADNELLLECSLEDPCPVATLIQHEIPGTSVWEDSECLLSALRDRTPGRYTYSSTRSTVFDMTPRTVEYTLVLDGSVNMLVSAVITSISANTQVRYDRTQRCTLASSEILEECLQIEAEGSDLSTFSEACKMLGDWITGCEEAQASCPSQR
jgi:hypothetical protein